MEVSNTPFLGDYAVWFQAKNVQSTIAYKTKVCGRGHGNAGIEERGILDGVTFEASSTEFEHCGSQTMLIRFVCRGYRVHRSACALSSSSVMVDKYFY